MSRKTYPPEYRKMIVTLARRGRSYWSLAREYEPSVQTIRKWVEEARRKQTPEARELTRNIQKLERETARLEIEVEILKKANEWFEQQEKGDKQ